MDKAIRSFVAPVVLACVAFLIAGGAIGYSLCDLRHRQQCGLRTVLSLKDLTWYCNNWISSNGGPPSISEWELIAQSSIAPQSLVDGWGNQIMYVVPSVRTPLGCEFYSIGENRIDEKGGGDDIGNWSTPGNYSTYDWNLFYERHLSKQCRTFWLPE